MGLIAIAAALLTACASVDQPAPGLSPARDAVAAIGSAAGNKAAAQVETDRLATAVVLPPTAVRLDSQPTDLSDPALGTPLISNLIDTKRYFTVPMSLSEAHTWFQTHRQPGLSVSGTSSSSDAHGPTGDGFQYDPTSAPPWPWGTAHLSIEVAPHGAAATFIRVDGVAEWIDPTPVRDTAPDPKIRLTIAQGCPASDRGLHDISNPASPDLDHRMLPDSTPTAALKCDYYGLNDHPFSLKDKAHLNGTQAAAAAARLAALPLGGVGVGAHSCPMDDGRATIEVFGYPGRADVDIWQSTSGCSSTDNGHIASGYF